MNVEILPQLNGDKLNIWRDFLAKASLDADMSVEETVLVWDDNELIATGSRDGNILKCIAVDESRQGEGLTATIVTGLRKRAFEDGYTHLFLYTKPMNGEMFASLFFYPVAETGSVLLMESVKNGLNTFVSALPEGISNEISGAVVANCNPFTLGHKYLIESASKQCDHLYVFVLSEDKSEFSAEDRFNMVKLGTEHIENVTVLPTGPYMISSATFPTYFLKDKEKADSIQCELDIEIFANHYAPKLNISKRFVGTEPGSPSTEMYNKALKEKLPLKGIDVIEIPRIECEGVPISARKTRELIKSKGIESIKNLVPETTFDYIRSKLIK